MKDLLIKEIESHGWENMGPQKDSNMLSFKRDHFRMNLWLTTGTVMIQDLEKKIDKGKRGSIYDENPIYK